MWLAPVARGATVSSLTAAVAEATSAFRLMSQPPAREATVSSTVGSAVGDAVAVATLSEAAETAAEAAERPVGLEAAVCRPGEPAVCQPEEAAEAVWRPVAEVVGTIESMQPGISQGQRLTCPRSCRWAAHARRAPNVPQDLAPTMRQERGRSVVPVPARTLVKPA
jgi:hypothetical protein